MQQTSFWARRMHSLSGDSPAIHFDDPIYRTAFAGAPMSKSPVVRDLIVDRGRMFSDVIKIKG